MLHAITLLILTTVFVLFIAYSERKNNKRIRFIHIWKDAFSVFKKRNGKIAIHQIVLIIGIPLICSVYCALEKPITRSLLEIYIFFAIGMGIVLVGLLILVAIFQSQSKSQKTLQTIRKTFSLIIINCLFCVYTVLASFWFMVCGNMNFPCNGLLIYYLIFLIILSMFIVIKRVYVLFTIINRNGGK